MSVRVLLVAPNDEAREGLARSLMKRSDVELIGATRNAREAEPFVSRDPDLVLVDPYDEDGRVGLLCRDLKATFSSPVVVLASFMTREHWNELRRAGVSKYLLRHVDTGRMANELQGAAREFAALRGDDADE